MRRERHEWAPAGARQWVDRCFAGITWNTVGALLAFCALYGAVLGMSQKTGGAPDSLAAYLRGAATALEIFVPAFAIVVITANFVTRQLGPRTLILTLAVAVGIIVGYCIMMGFDRIEGLWKHDRLRLLTVIQFLLVGWVGLAIYLLQERDTASRQALHDEAEREVGLERQLTEARIQILQSQIEPHFLFNSLAHVRRLYRVEPERGREMMGHLASYLGTALPAMREANVSLRQELDLSATYLNIQQIRMGMRLTFQIDVPGSVRDARIPPMMIATLVENAIKHGLGSLPEGGSIRISARRVANMLNVEVADSGVGLRATAGSGVGLSNIRARLEAHYGDAAKLVIANNTPRGVTATLVLPWSLSTSPLHAAPE